MIFFSSSLSIPTLSLVLFHYCIVLDTKYTIVLSNSHMSFSLSMIHHYCCHPLLDHVHSSFNAQSVKGNDIACKRCEISTSIKDNGVDLFCDRNMA